MLNLFTQIVGLNLKFILNRTIYHYIDSELVSKLFHIDRSFA